MPRRGRSGSDSDYDESPRKKAALRWKKRAQKPSTKAEIVMCATDTSPDRVGGHDKKISEEAVLKIKKALALAGHKTTGEQEARAALRGVAKLLRKYNVTQADIMAHESDAEKLTRAGRSVVSVKCYPDRPVKVNDERWASIMATTMTIFFDCRTYTATFKDRDRVDYNFYGLAEQTVAAAYAFEMAYNLTLAWSLKSKIPRGIHSRNCYRIGVADGLGELAEKERKEEKENALRKEQALLEARRKAEDEDDRSRIERLHGVNNGMDIETKTEEDGCRISALNAKVGVYAEGEGSSKKEEKNRVTIEVIDDEDMPHAQCNVSGWPDSDESAADHNDLNCDSAADHDDPDCDFVDWSDSDDDYSPSYLEHSAPPRPGSSSDLMPPPISTKPLSEQQADGSSADPDQDSPWNSVGQLVAFRESSVAIAEDFLKSEGIRLGHARSLPQFYLDGDEARTLYEQGQKDAEKIDVRRKRIKGVNNIDD